MTHAGKARRAGLKLLVLSMLLALVVLGIWSFWAGRLVGPAVAGIGTLWLIFCVFCLSFFRDPEPVVPAAVEVIVSPAHGTVDVIDETTEKKFLGGRCRRISIFLSVFDVHIQNAPIGGKVGFLEHTPGRFVNAMRADCGDYNENVLIGIESDEVKGERVAFRLIAGLIARRIVPWISPGEVVRKGQRASLIQFGSRVDLYLPLETKIEVALGQKVKGGETVMAKRLFR